MVKEVIKDIQRALIQSDVNIKLVLNLSKTIEDRALNEEPPKGVTAKEHVIKIVYDELVNLLGEKAEEVEIEKKPYKILFVGLQGSGKTTSIGKMARYLQKKGIQSSHNLYRHLEASSLRTATSTNRKSQFTPLRRP